MDNSKAIPEHNCNNSSSSHALFKKPAHLRVRVSQGPAYKFVKSILKNLGLHTVCEEAGCPNIYECFEAKTAAFLILGDTCTRNCRFCLVHSGKPLPPDLEEPVQIAQAVSSLGLKYAVITSVTRDDLDDGGASIYTRTIKEIKERNPGCGIEVLIPDLMGNWDALQLVVNANPDVLNHNIETVPWLYPEIRPVAIYERSLELLKAAKLMGFKGKTKSGILAGLGEEVNEIIEAMSDLRRHGCDILTIGQYLAPSKNHFPIQRYYDPREFKELEEVGIKMGFLHLEAGPLVRSSYHAKEQLIKTHLWFSSTQNKGKR